MNDIFYLSLVISIGYLIGRIRIKGVGLGISAVLLLALLAGHFGVTIPGIIKNIGLASFVAAVGLISGPTIVENLKKRATSYVLIGISMILVAALLCSAAIRLFDLPVPLALGLLAGALSSTPCLATGLEITQSSLTSVGYGIAYPFGVVGVVLAVQFISRMNDEKLDTETAETKIDVSSDDDLLHIDRKGMFPFFLSICLGVLLGKVRVPLPGGLNFSLGISGGVLISGLLLGGMRKIFNVSLDADRRILDGLREFGLTVFLAGAGIEAGSGFVQTLKEYGVILFLIGIVMTVVPIVFGFLMANKLMKLDANSSLGSVCGGMTSTTALGSLSELDGYERIAAGYAATYTVALISIVIAAQIVFILFS